MSNILDTFNPDDTTLFITNNRAYRFFLLREDFVVNKIEICKNESKLARKVSWLLDLSQIYSQSYLNFSKYLDVNNVFGIKRKLAKSICYILKKFSLVRYIFRFILKLYSVKYDEVVRACGAKNIVIHSMDLTSKLLALSAKRKGIIVIRDLESWDSFNLVDNYPKADYRCTWGHLFDDFLEGNEKTINVGFQGYINRLRVPEDRAKRIVYLEPSSYVVPFDIQCECLTKLINDFEGVDIVFKANPGQFSFLDQISSKFGDLLSYSLPINNVGDSLFKGDIAEMEAKKMNQNLYLEKDSDCLVSLFSHATLEFGLSGVPTVLLIDDFLTTSYYSQLEHPMIRRLKKAGVIISSTNSVRDALDMTHEERKLMISKLKRLIW